MIGEFIMRCLHVRTNAHVLHLKTRSYATHVALGEFYDGLVDCVDRYAEAYQGYFGLIENISGAYHPVDDPLKMISGLCEFVDYNREELSADEPMLQAILDDICELCSTTTYKLKFLK